MRNFNTIEHVIMLNKAKRFTDQTYADFLNNVRWGIATEDDYQKLSRRVFNENDMKMRKDFDMATHLFPTNK